MKLKLIEKQIEKDARGFFCFQNRMCEQNCFYSIKDLKERGEILSGSILFIQKSDTILLAAFTTAEHSEPRISISLENELPCINMNLFFDGEGDIPDEDYFICEFNTQYEAFVYLKNKLSPVGKKCQTFTGWSSWYHYFENFTAENLLQNLQILSDKKDLEIDYFQIDMGFAPKLGDWTRPSSNFPDGVAHFPGIIKKAGMKPGIWLAPFTAENDSIIVKEHPEWFYTEDNYIWKPIFNTPPWKALDLSHPEAFEFVIELGRNFRNMGYEYFKLDFLDMGIVPGKRYCNKLSGVELYRKVLSEFREIVKVPVLACNSFMPSTYDIADSMRINQDTAPFWRAKSPNTAGAEEALLTAFSRLFLHGGPTSIDPDCLLIRDRKSELTKDEIETYMNIIKISSGAIFISDDLTLVEDHKLKTVFTKMSFNNITAFPDNLFDSPQLHRLNLFSENKQIGEFIVNWGDFEQDFLILGTFRENYLTHHIIPQNVNRIKLLPHQSIILI